MLRSSAELRTESTPEGLGARKLALDARASAHSQRRGEQALEQLPLRSRVVPDVHQVDDRGMTVRSAEPLDRVAGRDLAGLGDADVQPRPPCLRKALDPVALPHPCREDRARDPRGGDLDEGAADPEPVADAHRLGTEARECQVLPEGPGLRYASQLGRPMLGVLAAVEVEGLVGAAVVLHVRDDVAHEPEPLDAPTLDRRLPDPRLDRPRADL